MVSDWEIDGLPGSVPFPMAMLTIHSLSVSQHLASASAADWFIKGCAMCYLVMHVKDP